MTESNQVPHSSLKPFEVVQGYARRFWKRLTMRSDRLPRTETPTLWGRAIKALKRMTMDHIQTTPEYKIVVSTNGVTYRCGGRQGEQKEYMQYPAYFQDNEGFWDNATKVRLVILWGRLEAFGDKRLSWEDSYALAMMALELKNHVGYLSAKLWTMRANLDALEVEIIGDRGDQYTKWFVEPFESLRGLRNVSFRRSKSLCRTAKEKDDAGYHLASLQRKVMYGEVMLPNLAFERKLNAIQSGYVIPPSDLYQGVLYDSLVRIADHPDTQDNDRDEIIQKLLMARVTEGDSCYPEAEFANLIRDLERLVERYRSIVECEGA